jgi:hypothetical protein
MLRRQIPTCQKGFFRQALKKSTAWSTKESGPAAGEGGITMGPSRVHSKPDRNRKIQFNHVGYRLFVDCAASTGSITNSGISRPARAR